MSKRTAEELATVDYRAILDSQLMLLGRVTARLERFRQLNAPRLFIERDVRMQSNRLRRVLRIQKRIDEMAVCDGLENL